MNDVITQKICPNYESRDMHTMAGGTTGQWMRDNCGHFGPVFEREITRSKEQNG